MINSPFYQFRIKVFVTIAQQILFLYAETLLVKQSFTLDAQTSCNQSHLIVTGL